MTPLLLGLFMDGLVAVLLVMAIIYSLRLNRRIKVLQDSKSELSELIQKFDLSMKNATAGIGEIHRASKKIHDNIQMKLDKANFIADDLAFMIDKGSKLSQKITDSGAVSGAQPKKVESPKLPPSSRGRMAGKRRGAAVEANSPAMEPVDVGFKENDGQVADANRTGRSQQTSERSRRAIEAMARKGAAKNPKPAVAQPPKEANVKPLSASERELMEALKEKY